MSEAPIPNTERVAALPEPDQASLLAHLLAGGSVFVDAQGDRRWLDRDGILHREDGPALERANGWREWLWHGEYHREDGPALEFGNGVQVWCYHGVPQLVPPP